MVMERIKQGDSDTEESNKKDDSRPVPPGAQELTPIKEPDKRQKPLGDPQSPEKKKPRL
jgi:hypothetical protein